MLRPTTAVDAVGAPDASWDSRRNKKVVRLAEANITVFYKSIKTTDCLQSGEKRNINDSSPRVESGRKKDEKQWTCAAPDSVALRTATSKNSRHEEPNCREHLVVNPGYHDIYRAIVRIDSSDHDCFNSLVSLSPVNGWARLALAGHHHLQVGTTASCEES